MGFYSNWFLAEKGDAEAISSIVTTEEHSFEDWPHLSLKDVSEMDLSALWGILRVEPDSLDTATGDLLHRQGDEVFVCLVEPGFVDLLAAVNPSTIKRLAETWHKSEGLTRWNLKEVESAIRQLVDFTGRAKRERKPILQLSVL